MLESGTVTHPLRNSIALTFVCLYHLPPLVGAESVLRAIQ
jgi:hypothetical protein